MLYRLVPSRLLWLFRIAKKRTEKFSSACHDETGTTNKKGALLCGMQVARVDVTYMKVRDTRF